MNVSLCFENDKSVLDVGCGLGSTVDTYGVPDHVAIYGIDVNAEVIEQAKLLYKDRPNRFFLVCPAEDLRHFESNKFDKVISGVTLMYIKIPKTMREVYRVLVPGGTFSASYETWKDVTKFMLRALTKLQIKVVIHRLYILMNGILFYLTGYIVPYLNGTIESFQSRRGLRITLGRAGFENIRFDGYRVFADKKSSSKFD